MKSRAAAVVLSVALIATFGGYHLVAKNRAYAGFWAFIVALLAYGLSIVIYNPLRKRK